MNLNLTDPKVIALAATVVVILAAVVWLYIRKRSSATADLRQKFGPEYDRAVLAHGSERKAEAKLVDREKRIEKLNIRDLDPMEHERYSKQGSRCSLVLSIPRRGQLQKPMTWCPL